MLKRCQISRILVRQQSKPSTQSFIIIILLWFNMLLDIFLEMSFCTAPLIKKWSYIFELVVEFRGKSTSHFAIMTCLMCLFLCCPQESELSEDNTPQKPLHLIRAQLSHHHYLVHNSGKNRRHVSRFCEWFDFLQICSSFVFKRDNCGLIVLFFF